MTPRDDEGRDLTPWYRDRWLIVGLAMLASFAFTAVSLAAALAYLIWLAVQ